MGETKIYEDEAGNCLYKKWISSRNTWQYYGKNTSGRLLSPVELKILMKSAMISMRVPKAPGVHRVSAPTNVGLDINKETRRWN